MILPEGIAESSANHSLGDTIANPEVVIAFNNLDEFISFENLIAPEVNPMLDREVWARRFSIKDYVKPPKFHGTLSDIAVAPMEDPIKDLRNAVNDGVGFQKGASHQGVHRYREWWPYVRGFDFFAQPKSSSGKLVKSIALKLWYTPVDPVRGASFGPAAHCGLDKDGNTVHRIITKHKKEVTDEHRALFEKSKCIGYSVLSAALQKPPIPTPFRN